MKNIDIFPTRDYNPNNYAGISLCVTEVNKMKKTGILFITALLFVSMVFVGCKKSEAAATEETVIQEETVVEPAVEAAEEAAAVVE